MSTKVVVTSGWRSKPFIAAAVADVADVVAVRGCEGDAHDASQVGRGQPSLLVVK